MILVRHGYSKVVSIDERLCFMLYKFASKLDAHLVRRFGVGKVVTQAILSAARVMAVEKITGHLVYPEPSPCRSRS